jgi:hypothetical protein
MKVAARAAVQIDVRVVRRMSSPRRGEGAADELGVARRKSAVTLKRLNELRLEIV